VVYTSNINDENDGREAVAGHSFDFREGEAEGAVAFYGYNPFSNGWSGGGGDGFVGVVVGHFSGYGIAKAYAHCCVRAGI